jgi:geranylgeranyl pyrophosphate synthase
MTGKPRGIDLRDGNPSLPIVLALAADPELRRLFARPQLAAAEIEAGLGRIGRSGVLKAVTERAREHVGAAMTEIERLPPSPCRTALETLTLGLVERPR